MEDEYGMSDLSSRQFIVGDRPSPAISHPPPPHRSFLTTDNLPYYMLNFTGSRAEAHGGGRWPRQETLTLLEIRSRLHPKFKEANQKGPLWDELSRIMCEESGYQRSGKKCREKFENLYKYYKKTKTAGRQDGKHYRFFRQLEALYGDTTTHNNNNNNNNNNNSSSSNQDFISISNSSDFDNFISSDEEEDTKTGRSLKEKIKESIEMQMKEMMEKQDAWMETMMKKIEANEQESISREEQRRREDFERIEREQRMWAREKAWIQARDAALMDAFMKMAGTTKEEANLVYSTSTRPEEAELMDVGFGIDIISSTMSRQHVHHHHQQQNDGHESISEQGIDHGSSPPDYNAMADVGGFRYFGGESYGGL